MKVGAHVSVAGGVDNAIERLLDVGGNCGQIFTTSPQVWQHPDIDDDEAQRFRTGTNDSAIGPWVIHSAYLVNLATPSPDLREQSIASLQADIDAADRLGVKYVNVHPGAHTGAGVETGLENTASALDALDVPDDVQVLVETDAGSGTKLGGEPWHLARILDRTELDLGVCLDTAHTFVAGHDLSTPAGVDETVRTFEDTVGLDALSLVHLNDSKHAGGTHRDEHAHVGTGEIGVDGIRALLNHKALRDLPFVLETPTEDGKGFAWNIERVRELRS